jgi:nicotinamidase-related amidase
MALLRPNDTILVAIDLQDAFLNVIHERDRVIACAGLLLRAAPILGVPIIATTQNQARLGGMAADLADLLGDASVVDKLAFSAVGAPPFVEALQAAGRSQVLICGVETHICITQTTLDLIALGYQVHVAADAVSSRILEKHKLGMERIRDHGGLPVAAEAAVYELLGQAGTPEFRQILPLVR